MNLFVWLWQSKHYATSIRLDKYAANYYIVWIYAN